jgi:hypothetical protein
MAHGHRDRCGLHADTNADFFLHTLDMKMCGVA